VHADERPAFVRLAQVVPGVFVALAAALDDENLEAGPEKLERERDPGRARTDDADVCIEF
jgi:hypothetical protein